MKADRTSAAVALAATGAVLALALPLASRANTASADGHTSSGCAPGAARARGFASYVPALRTYDDNIEDSGGAPDFCASELVTNDNTTITIGIHAHNRTGFVAGDSYTVYLDTDRNPATGGGGVGAEYEIVFTGPLAQLEQWNGTAFDPASAVPVPLIWVPDYGPVLVFLRSAIGDPAGFNFVLVSANGQAGDRAPDTGSWSYSTEPFALKMKSLSIGPARAGKTMTARTVVMRSDFDVPLDQGRIGCAARLGRHSLAGKGKFAGGRVVCTWRVPKNTGRQRLSGTVSVTYQGARASRSFVARVT
jgi:hypothetical protein